MISNGNIFESCLHVINQVEIFDKMPRKYKKLRQTFRVAVVQMESHPAITVETTDYTAEPFIEFEEPQILAGLLRHGDGNGVQDLQDMLRKTYLRWAGSRLNGVLRYFKKLVNGEKSIQPDIIIFSEFAVPFEHLHLLRDFSHKNNCIIIAGNHAYNRRAEDYKPLFGYLPFMEPPHPDGANSVLVAFAPPDKQASLNESKYGAWHRFKYKLSPFEFTSVHIEPPPIPSETKRRKPRAAKLHRPETVWHFTEPFEIAIDILVCAEALQDVSCDTEANMLVVCAYHRKPEDFTHILNQTSKLQKLAVLASEGTFGFSTINLNYDRRFASWWLREPNNGVLPPGNSILIYDVPFKHVSASAGSTNPFKEYKEIRVSDIVSADKGDEHFLVSQQIGKLFSANIEYSSMLVQQNLARNVRSILRLRKPSALQKIKFHYLADLAQLGMLNFNQIRSLADDCVFRDESEVI